MEQIKKYLIVCTFLFFSSLSIAQNCDCSITIDKEGVFDGTVLGAKPGDVVCLKAGKYNHLRFKNFIGSQTNPILIKNCGGQVLIEHNSYWSALEFYNCRYIKASGSGSLNYKYGFKINVLSSNPNGVSISELSSNFELDHIEVMKAGFAGVMAKTDPKCDLTANRPNFTMNDISIHDNFIHNTGGEGFYIGHSFYSGYDQSTDCKGKMLYPHEIHKLRIFNNITDSTGCEAIQVGSATQDVEIYNNYVTNYGIKPFDSFQNNGIQISDGTTGRLYNNFVINGKDTSMNKKTAMGIIVFPFGSNYIYNNVVVNFIDAGIFVDNRSSTQNNGLVVLANNTLVTKNMSKSEGIRCYSEITNNKIFNNIIAGTEKSIRYLTTQKLADEKSNFFSTKSETVGFENLLKNNFQLKPTSICVDKGIDVSTLGIKNDFNKHARPQNFSYDIGAFEYQLKTILQSNNEQYIQVYPNPARDFITINIPNNEFYLDLQFSIFDIYGRLISQTIPFESQTSIPIKNLDNGIYFLKIRSRNVKFNTRFIKE